MIRSISPAATDSSAKAVILGVRATEGFGERASNDAIEQQSVAVKQAAVVALGTGTRGTSESGSYAAVTYSRPPPSSRQSGSPATSPTSAANDTSLASLVAQATSAKSDAATATVVAKSDAATAVAKSDAAAAAAKSDDSSTEIAAGSFFALSAQPIKGDTEATLQKLLQMRDEALAPPASVADLAIATAAAMRISRLVRERYAVEQASVSPQKTPDATIGTRPTLPPAGVKA